MTATGELGQPPAIQSDAGEVELSVVMPCLNEAETLGNCIRKAQLAMAGAGVAGEIIVADNGSTDGSAEIASSLGARVVSVPLRGYGHALMGGIDAARGRFILMGDADDSYDFRELPRFLDKLREGNDLVQGCRLKRGGGQVLLGAMPVLHRRIGNPMLSRLVRSWYSSAVSDAYCGMRAFTREHYDSLAQRCTGMEFAIEMIVKSTFTGARVAEVPITLSPDGRTAHKAHLRTVRDGWRTLRFLLLYSPRWLFLVPGVLLCVLGAAGYAVALPGLHAFGVTFDAHTLLFSTLAIICGYQAILFSVITKEFAVGEGLMPPNRRLDRAMEVLTLERVLVIAGCVMVAGLVLLGLAFNDWRLHHFGRLDYPRTMRLVVPGMLLVAVSFQTVLSGFFISIMGQRR